MLTGAESSSVAARPKRSWLAKALRIEWLGQTAASVAWIASMLIYGLDSAADWLQLLAASAWLVANFAALASQK